jgi:hypothetical protein
MNGTDVRRDPCSAASLWRIFRDAVAAACSAVIRPRSFQAGIFLWEFIGEIPPGFIFPRPGRHRFRAVGPGTSGQPGKALVSHPKACGARWRSAVQPQFPIFCPLSRFEISHPATECDSLFVALRYLMDPSPMHADLWSVSDCSHPTEDH